MGHEGACGTGEVARGTAARVGGQRHERGHGDEDTGVGEAGSGTAVAKGGSVYMAPEACLAKIWELLRPSDQLAQEINNTTMDIMLLNSKPSNHTIKK